MKVRKGSSTEFILIALEKSIDGACQLIDFAYNPHGYSFGSRSDYQLSKTLLSISLKRMREKGLIEFEDAKTDHIVIKLTNLGKDALGELSATDEEWDGVWRLVIFDVPESKRVVRNLFRRRLKDWGFKIWQKSVWYGKRNTTKKLRDLIKRLEIDEWVAVIETSDPSLITLLERSSN